MPDLTPESIEAIQAMMKSNTNQVLEAVNRTLEAREEQTQKQIDLLARAIINAQEQTEEIDDGNSYASPFDQIVTPPYSADASTAPVTEQLAEVGYTQIANIPIPEATEPGTPFDMVQIRWESPDLMYRVRQILITQDPLTVTISGFGGWNIIDTAEACSAT